MENKLFEGYGEALKCLIDNRDKCTIKEQYGYEKAIGLLIKHSNTK